MVPSLGVCWSLLRQEDGRIGSSSFSHTLAQVGNGGLERPPERTALGCVQNNAEAAAILQPLLHNVRGNTRHFCEPSQSTTCARLHGPPKTQLREVLRRQQWGCQKHTAFPLECPPQFPESLSHCSMLKRNPIFVGCGGKFSKVFILSFDKDQF